jgi:hypothetical protein
MRKDWDLSPQSLSVVRFRFMLEYFTRTWVTFEDQRVGNVSDEGVTEVCTRRR